MSRLTGELKTITRCMRRFKDEKLRPYGLVSRQSELLLAISRLPDGSQDQLAELLMINKSNVARHLAVLEEKGLVRRQPNPADRRLAQVFLTGEAEALLPALREINNQWADYVTRGLSAEEQEALERLLARVVTHLKGEDET